MKKNIMFYVIKEFYLIVNDIQKIFDSSKNKDEINDIYQISPIIKKFFNKIYALKHVFKNDQLINWFYKFDIKNDYFYKKEKTLESFSFSLIMRIYLMKIRHNYKKLMINNNKNNKRKKEILSNKKFLKNHSKNSKILSDFVIYFCENIKKNNKRFLDNLIKEIFPLFLHCYDISKKNKIINLAKWEKPDFIIETNEIINFYEYTTIDNQNNIKKISEKLINKIKKIKEYKKNINTFYSSISNKKKKNFQIIVWSTLSSNNEEETKKLISKIINYLEQHKENKEIINIIKGNENKIIEFKFFNFIRLNS